MKCVRGPSVSRTSGQPDSVLWSLCALLVHVRFKCTLAKSQPFRSSVYQSESVCTGTERLGKERGKLEPRVGEMIQWFNVTGYLLRGLGSDSWHPY